MESTLHHYHWITLNLPNRQLKVQSVDNDLLKENIHLDCYSLDGLVMIST